jgi:hypothetical protein
VLLNQHGNGIMRWTRHCKALFTPMSTKTLEVKAESEIGLFDGRLGRDRRRGMMHRQGRA